MLTNNSHPISLFSETHSSKEKNFTSINHITFSAMERAALFGKATFVMDRGYDDSKMFLKLDSMKQDYGIRLTAKRKLLYHNKWVFATELRNRRTSYVLSGAYFHEIKNQSFKSCKYTNCKSNQRKHIFLLLPVSKRHLRHTVVCKRRHPALVQDKTSRIPSTLP